MDVNELFSKARPVVTAANRNLGLLNSAAQVNGVPMGFSSPVFTGLESAISRIAGISEATSARAEAMSEAQREWSANQAAITRGFNSAEAAKNRDWQEFMSNTAHQREVADLRAAGLNPVLSAMGGNGAAVTSGANASASNPNGAEAQPDSMTNALVSLLGTFLTAQTRLFEATTSAQTQEAVADKYNAVSQLVAQLQSETSKDVARTSAEASERAAYLHMIGQKYGADVQSAINDAMLSQERWRLENYPNNTLQVISSILGGFGVVGDTVRGNVNSAKREINKFTNMLGIGPVFEFDNRADAYGSFSRSKKSGSFGGRNGKN